MLFLSPILLPVLHSVEMFLFTFADVTSYLFKGLFVILSKAKNLQAQDKCIQILHYVQDDKIKREHAFQHALSKQI